MMKIGVYTKSVEGVWFGVACDEEQVFATSFGRDEKAALKSLLDCVPLDVEFQVFSEPSPFAEQVLGSVKSVYDGKGVPESFPLATEKLTAFNKRVLEVTRNLQHPLEKLTAFNKRVLEVTRLIPVGYVASYGSLSEAAGGSARAVGGVMAADPFAPIVPCHPVVRSAFTLGGYR